MKRLYLDANIYVDFYDLQSSATNKLLPALGALARYVFVTEQIAHEVNRNKLHKAKHSCDQMIERLRASNGLPAFIDSIVKALPKQYRRWGPPPKQAIDEIEQQVSLKLRAVSESTDDVSIALKPIFETAVPATSGEFKAARMRKERGNPPGKRADPLGDQLSWEQLLAHVNSDDELWVVTRDTDYYVKALQDCLLHPLLLNDLISHGLQRDKIHVFDSLAKALQDFNSKPGVRVRKLPRKAVLATAVAEEQSKPARQTQLGRYLEKEIELLPRDLRVVFVLSDVEGYPPTKIAEMTGMSVQEVNRNIRIARLRLSDILRSLFA